MVAVTGGDGTTTDGGEVSGCVDVVDAENREAPMKGVSPAFTRDGKRIFKVRRKLAVDDVRRRRIEIPAEEGGGVRESGRCLCEDPQGGGEFLLADYPVVAMLYPRFLFPEAQIGGSRSEMDIHHLD